MADQVIHHVQLPRTEVSSVVTPGSLDDALAWMARPGTKPIAGGTDLMVELDRGQHGDVTTLLDLTRVPGLDSISETDGTITIGASVTHNQCVASELLVERAAPLVQACWEVGSAQLRNRATIAGNIVTASPANDTLSPLVALGADLTLASVRGTRTIPLGEFHLGVRQTALAEDELVTAISFPALGDDWRSLYLKLGLRRAQAISVVHLAVVARFDGERVDEIRLALGSVAPTIVRAAEAEGLLAGNELADDLIAAAADAAAASVSPIDDLRATADYRSELVAEMVRRALVGLRDDAGLVPDRPPLLWGSGDGRWPTGEDFAVEHGPETPIVATVNGRETSAPGVASNLLDWLRATGATGTKEGCAEGECGSCTVHLDGTAVLSCLVPATRANGATVVTIEGLGETPSGDPGHPLQRAFIEAGAVQCGFCIPGFLMSGANLLDEHPDPSADQIRAGLAGNLCRCTGYYKIVDAVRIALDGHAGPASTVTQSGPGQVA